ncbi:MAG: hypothetical protein SGPRY_011476 [Prymnesium sp.]
MLFRSQAKVPALQQERDQLLEGLVQKDAVLELAEKRSSSLAAQLAALEKSTLAQWPTVHDHKRPICCVPCPQGDSALEAKRPTEAPSKHKQALSRAHRLHLSQAMVGRLEHQSELRKAREQTRMALEEQRSHFEKSLREANDERNELLQVVRKQAAELKVFTSSRTEVQAGSSAMGKHERGGTDDGNSGPPEAALPSPWFVTKSFTEVKSSTHPQDPLGTKQRLLPPYAPPNVAVAAAVGEASAHGLDRNYQGEPEPDPFAASFELSKVRRCPIGQDSGCDCTR